jgi:hypothetical protein
MFTVELLMQDDNQLTVASPIINLIHSVAVFMLLVAIALVA